MEPTVADFGAYAVCAFRLALSTQRALQKAGLVDAEDTIKLMRDLLQPMVDRSQSPPAIDAPMAHAELEAEIRRWEARQGSGPSQT